MVERLVFKIVDDLNIEFGMEYYPGCFTPTGLKPEYLDQISMWCIANNCGVVNYLNRTISFSNKKDLAFFMLKWS